MKASSGNGIGGMGEEKKLAQQQPSQFLRGRREVGNVVVVVGTTPPRQGNKNKIYNKSRLLDCWYTTARIQGQWLSLAVVTAVTAVTAVSWFVVVVVVVVVVNREHRVKDDALI